jgi:hypothetical protein
MKLRAMAHNLKKANILGALHTAPTFQDVMMKRMDETQQPT